MFVATNKLKASVPIGTEFLKMVQGQIKWLIASQSSTSSPYGTEHAWFYQFLQTFSPSGTEIMDFAVSVNILSR